MHKRRPVLPPRSRFDFETYSEIDLTQVGSWKYSEHPSTKVLVGTFDIDGDLIAWVPDGRYEKLPSQVKEVYTGTELPHCLQKELKHGRRLVASNAEFEYAILKNTVEYPIDRKLIECTAGMQSYFHLARNLDEGARQLGFAGKMIDAKAIIEKFCIPPDRGDGKGRNATGQMSMFESAQDVNGPLDELIAYNVQDVEQTIQIDNKLAPWYPESEVAIFQQTLGMNERGLPIDFDYLRAFEHIRESAPDHLSFDGQDYMYAELASAPQIKQLLAKVGWPCLTLNKYDIENALNDLNTPPLVRFLLEARRDASRVSLGKLAVILRYACEDRVLRGAYVYGGTDTLRWASWGAQVQNLPKPDKGIKSKVCIEAIKSRDVQAVIKAGDGYHNRALVAGLAGLIWAGPGYVFTKSDFAQVEARFVLWLADDHVHLSWWREGRDMYSEMATRLFGREIKKGRDDKERDVGKRLVLACNFQLGGAKFENIEAPKYGIDMKKLGITGDGSVAAFRKEFQSLSHKQRGLWARLMNACIDCVGTGRTIYEAHLIFRKVGNHLFVELPSGRDHIFRNARIVTGTKRNNDTGETWEVTSMISTNADGVDEDFYGGKLADIFTQASCRDLQAGAMLKAEEAGLDIRMQTHDEIVIRSRVEDAKTEFALLEKIMTTTPTWCANFPIAVDSHTYERYAK